MKFRWALAPAQPLLSARLAQLLGIQPLLAQCLLNRGLDDPAAADFYLKPRLKDMLDPYLLPDMAAAVERLVRAREANERLAVFGDYDVDGVTSTAILLQVLRSLGWQVEPYLPRRLDEGYGLTLDAAQNCLERCRPTLLIAVDCGSSSAECIDYLRGRGVDTIVLDHHQAGGTRPKAVALINPHARSDCAEGSKRPQLTELCSAGLTFKLSHALVKRGRELGWAAAMDLDVRNLLDLAALGTIADVVPLKGENRIIVSAGLARLNTTQRPGIVALKKVAQCAETLSVRDVGFQLAPRLNAAGRLESAEHALELLMAKDLQEAMPIAEALDKQNRERQSIERSISKEVIQSLEEKFRAESDYVIVEGQAPWHIGVVGIVAARILQRFYRPTIVMGGADGGEWRGSGRSIAGFDLAAGLRECGDLLVRHGGHAMAAGLSIRSDKLPEFRERLNAVARSAIKAEHLHPELELDAEVGLEELTVQSLQTLDGVKPVGHGNRALQFCCRRLTHQRPLQRMGVDKQHVKMWVSDGVTTREAVWWGAGQESLPVGKFDLAFAPELNRYNERDSVQLKVLDWRAGAADNQLL